MLYLFYGDDSEKKRGAIDALPSMHASASVFFASKGDDYGAIIDEHAGSASLFGEKSVIIFDDALADKDARASLLARMKELADSQNIFIFLEPKALKDTLTAFAKAKGIVAEFLRTDKKASTGEVNVFALTDAFARKDKKESWVILQKAFMARKSPEEVAGLLFWQVKTLLLAKDPRATAASLNMKPFVFSKASAAARSWETIDLEKAASALVYAAHESRRGEVDAESALERVVLTAL